MHALEASDNFPGAVGVHAFMVLACTRRVHAITCSTPVPSKVKARRSAAVYPSTGPKFDVVNRSCQLGRWRAMVQSSK
jgi:hypothetical protein